jgi:hypothetical protein
VAAASNDPARRRRRKPEDVIGVTTSRIAAQRVSTEGQEGMRRSSRAETGLDPVTIRRLLYANRGEVAVRIIRRMPRGASRAWR